MALVDFLNPGCYNQLYLIESKLKALKCGIFEGLYWAMIVSFVIIISAFRMILNSKKTEINPEQIKNYSLILICVIFITLISFYSIGYVNKWNSYQKLIQIYKSRGLRDYEIFYLLELEIGRNTSTIGSALATTSGLLFLGPRGEKKEEKEKEKKEKETDKESN